MDKNTSLIPKGLYCYSIEGDKRVKCPYWAWDNRDTSMQGVYGYCHYLECGDNDEDGTTFLFDQVKECGINMEEEEENE